MPGVDYSGNSDSLFGGSLEEEYCPYGLGFRVFGMKALTLARSRN